MKEILTELHNLYSNLFERKRDVTLDKYKHFLDTINFPKDFNEHNEKSNYDSYLQLIYIS